MRRRTRREAKAFGQSQYRLQMLSPPLPLSLLTVSLFLSRLLLPRVLSCPLSSLISLSLFSLGPVPFPSNLTFSKRSLSLLIHPQRSNNVG